jgi:hypothetical protein
VRAFLNRLNADTYPVDPQGASARKVMLSFLPEGGQAGHHSGGPSDALLVISAKVQPCRRPESLPGPPRLGAGTDRIDVRCHGQGIVVSTFRFLCQ